MHLYRHGTLVLFFSFLPLFTVANEYQAFDSYSLVSESESFTYLATPSSASLAYEAPDLQWLAGTDDRERPVLDGAGMIGVPGAPELPVYRRLVAVPSGFDAQIRNVRYHWQQEGSHSITHDSGASGEVSISAELYRAPLFSMDEPVTIGETSRWADIRFAEITLRPVHYDPETGVTHSLQWADIELEFVPAGDDGYDPPGVSEALLPLYEQYVMGSLDNLDLSQVRRGSYLVIAPSIWEPTLQSLLDWRAQTGFNVIFASTSETGSSRSQIHDYIWEQYETLDPPLEYVALVGDIDTPANIPTFFINSGALDPNIGTDHPYANDPDGGNSFADVLPRYQVGRISVDNTTQLVTVINKIIQYEANPDNGSLDRFSKALVIADATFAISTKYTKLWVKQKLLENGFDIVDEIIRENWPGPPSSAISNSINAGRSWVNYRGFGAHDAWAGPYFTNVNVAALDNTNMLPVITSMVCGGGAFDEPDDDPCFGEQWIRNGSPNTLTGAVAFIGPSEIDTHTRWNNIVDGGWYRGMLDFGLRSMGQCMLASKMELYNSYPNSWNANGSNQTSVWFYFHTYNILGDPALQLRVEMPRYLDVDHAATVPANATHLDMMVQYNDNGAPVRDALAVVTQNGSEIVGAARTQTDGSADIVFWTAPDGDDLTVTVSRPDLIPYIDELNGGSVSGPILTDAVFNEDVNDPDTNGDGQVNPGELMIPALSFDIEVEGGIDNLEIEVELPDGVGEVLSPVQSFGNIANGGSVTLTTPRIRIDSGLNHQEPFEILFTFSGDGFEFTHAVVYDQVQAPLLQVEEDHLFFSENWNPGVETDLDIPLSNLNEDLAAGEVTGVLSSSDPFIDIVQPNGVWADIGAGQSLVSQSEFYTVQALEEVYPGREIPVTLELTTEEGYHSVRELTLTVAGLDETVPTGPAGPGYYMYEDIDVGYGLTPEVYEYQPVNSNGSLLPLSDYGNNMDASVVVELPFEFPYWYQNYDSITVCSNGWFSFGESEFIFFRNRPIPGSLTPYGGIAVFWDDLIMSSGGVYTYHDETNGWFVIEWHDVRLYNSSRWEMSFQAKILDPSVHPAPGGMGMIVLLYDTVDNFDSFENYCTIGIISPDGSDGLLYEFADDPVPSAGGVEDGRKILIAVGQTGGVSDPRLVVTPPDVNMNVQQGETAQSTFTLTNTGGMPLWYELIPEGIWGTWFNYGGNGPASQLASASIAVDPEASGGSAGIDLAGGPDSYGYKWLDSDQIGGPVFGWLDITETGEVVELFGEGNGSLSEEIPLPFDFRYYGETYSSFWICESGYIVFDDPEGEGRMVNYALPQTYAPSAGLFPFWDNIGTDESGTIYTQAYEDSVVISWVDVRHQSWSSDDGPYTFQILLTSDGAVHFRYLEMNPRLISSTIGIQNSGGHVGLTAMYNNSVEDYPRDSLAIRFVPPAPWLNADPLTGMLGPGESEDVTVVANAVDLDEGEYFARLLAMSPSSGQAESIPVGLVVLEGDAGVVPAISELPGESIALEDGFTDLHLDPYVYDADNRDAELRWAAYGDEMIDVSIDDNRVAHFSAAEDWMGPSTIYFQVLDSNRNLATRALTLSSGNANDRPRFVSATPELDTLGLENSVTFTVEVIDPEEDDIEVEWFLDDEPVGTGLSVNLSFPVQGDHTLRAVASDGLLESTTRWALWVSSNSSPANPEAAIPDVFALEHLYPNPFNHQVVLRYTLPQTADVQLQVYNLLGQEVARRSLRAVQPGRHEVAFNGADWATGMYFFRWQAGGVTMVRKAMLLK